MFSSTSQHLASEPHYTTHPSSGQVVSQSRILEQNKHRRHAAAAGCKCKMEKYRVVQVKKKKKSLNVEIDSLHFSSLILGCLDFFPIFKGPLFAYFLLSGPLLRNIVDFFPLLSGLVHIPFKVWAHVPLPCYCMLHFCPSDTKTACIWMHVRAHVRSSTYWRCTCLQPAV